MKKLLILAYDFPPYVSVGGLRPFSWYKYLHRFGIEPVVVTRQWQNKFGSNLDYLAAGYSDKTEIEETPHGTIYKTPFEPNAGNKIFLKYGESRFRIVRKTISSYYEFLQFVFFTGNKRNLYFEADEFLKNNKVDCIIATGDPFVLFKYASKLSRKYSVPWIADYRDAWIQDNGISNPVFKKWCAFFEKRFLKNVSRITTVSTFIQKQIESNIEGKKFELIYNGFDPEILETTENIKQSEKILSIGLAGTIYASHPIESFFRVCNALLDEDKNFKLNLNFYGINKETELRELLAEKFPRLEKFVNFYPRMANLLLVTELAKQNACLLFNDYSILSTKIFDYLAVRRQILLCYENDPEAEQLKKDFFWIEEMETESQQLQAEMITATNSGIVVKDAAHLKTVLLELSDELRQNGFVACHSQNIENFSRIRQVEKLAETIKSLD